MHEEPNKLLKRAVSEITFNMNVNKLSPHDAVVKVAKDLELNVHFIKRASEAINVALTHFHFKKHAEARDEDFPIVDAKQVTEEVFNTSGKTENEKKAEWFSAVDVTDEVPDFNKLLLNQNFKQAFEIIITSSEKNDDFDTSDKGKFDKIAKLRDKMELDLNNWSTKLAGVSTDLNRSFATIVNQFSRDEGYRSSFAEFEKQAYATYGDRAVPYLDFIHKTIGAKEARGEHNSKYSNFDTCLEVNMLGTLLKSASALAEVENIHADKTMTYLKVRESIKEAYHKLCEKEAEEVLTQVPAVEKKAKEEVLVEETDPVMKLAKEKIAVFNNELSAEEEFLTPHQRSLLPESLKREIIRAKQAGDEGPLNRVKKAFDLVGPAMDKFKQESTPRTNIPSTSYHDNLERKLLLERMLVTDPILSNADPKRVVDAYQQFLHLAPELSKEPEVVKGALRNMVASQSVDPHTAQQFVEANTSFTNQKLQQHGVGKK